MCWLYFLWGIGFVFIRDGRQRQGLEMNLLVSSTSVQCLVEVAAPAVLRARDCLPRCSLSMEGAVFWPNRDAGLLMLIALLSSLPDLDFTNQHDKVLAPHRQPHQG